MTPHPALYELIKLLAEQAVDEFETEQEKLRRAVRTPLLRRPAPPATDDGNGPLEN